MATTARADPTMTIDFDDFMDSPDDPEKNSDA
jgi:hypothetical protein